MNTQDSPEKDVAASPRQRIVLELLATAIRHERFEAASGAFVTELATRLGCDRVSLGFVRGRRAQVQVISHTAQFERRINLVRAIEAAMDEAQDQESTVVFPQTGGAETADFRITRAHEELQREHGSDAICSIPSSEPGNASAVLTLERVGDRPFDSRVVELCETALNMAVPLLRLKWREERWLVTKGWESLGHMLRRILGRGHLGWKLGSACALSLILCLSY